MNFLLVILALGLLSQQSLASPTKTQMTYWEEVYASVPCALFGFGCTIMGPDAFCPDCPESPPCPSDTNCDCPLKIGLMDKASASRDTVTPPAPCPAPSPAPIIIRNADCAFALRDTQLKMDTLMGEGKAQRTELERLTAELAESHRLLDMARFESLRLSVRLDGERSENFDKLAKKDEELLATKDALATLERSMATLARESLRPGFDSAKAKVTDPAIAFKALANKNSTSERLIIAALAVLAVATAAASIYGLSEGSESSNGPAGPPASPSLPKESPQKVAPLNKAVPNEVPKKAEKAKSKEAEKPKEEKKAKKKSESKPKKDEDGCLDAGITDKVGIIETALASEKVGMAKFKVANTPSDGKCQYNSILEAWRTNPNPKVAPYATADSLCLALHKAITETYAIGFEAMYAAMGESAESVASRLAQIKTASCWGRNDTVMAAALVLQRNIAVHRVLESGFHSVVVYHHDVTALYGFMSDGCVNDVDLPVLPEETIHVVSLGPDHFAALVPR